MCLVDEYNMLPRIDYSNRKTEACKNAVSKYLHLIICYMFDVIVVCL